MWMWRSGKPVTNVCNFYWKVCFENLWKVCWKSMCTPYVHMHHLRTAVYHPLPPSQYSFNRQIYLTVVNQWTLHRPMFVKKYIRINCMLKQEHLTFSSSQSRVSNWPGLMIKHKKHVNWYESLRTIYRPNLRLT